jgi:hypothetical protein
MMHAKNTVVTKMRPISWKIFVLGRDAAEHVQQLVRDHGITVGDVEQEPGLSDPPLFSFVASPKANTPLTALELEAVLRQDERIEVAFRDD